MDFEGEIKSHTNNLSHKMKCFARFGTICTIQKTYKHPWKSVTFSEVRGLNRAKRPKLLDTLGFASCALSQKETSYSKSPRRYVRKDFTERQNSQLSAFNESHAPKDFSYNKQENHNVITILFLIATPVFLVLESINVDQSLHVQHKYSRRRVPLLIWFIDPFVSNAPFLYPLKTSKNLKVF